MLNLFVLNFVFMKLKQFTEKLHQCLKENDVYKLAALEGRGEGERILVGLFLVEAHIILYLNT